MEDLDWTPPTEIGKAVADWRKDLEKKKNEPSQQKTQEELSLALARGEGLRRILDGLKGKK